MTQLIKKQHGVTLVEIAIVLVVIGLLLGGILKGQELINSAKVRAMAERQTSLKTAWFAFLDRYQAMPGDYADADKYIPGAAAGDGDGIIIVTESPVVFQHLTGAGLLRCSQCTASVTVAPKAENSLLNSYGGIMSIFNDDDYYAAIGPDNGSTPEKSRLLIHTGPRIPSNIITEVDRKIDDGVANTGDLVFNNYDPSGAAPEAKECMSPPSDNATDTHLVTKVPRDWRHANASGGAVESNCGASLPI